MTEVLYYTDLPDPTKPIMSKQERKEAYHKQRAAYWAEKRPNWLKEPIIKIERPLRQLKELLSEIVIKEDGTKELRISPLYFMARDFADAGDGEAVKFMLRLALAERA